MLLKYLLLQSSAKNHQKPGVRHSSRAILLASVYEFTSFGLQHPSRMQYVVCAQTCWWYIVNNSNIIILSCSTAVLNDLNVAWGCMRNLMELQWNHTICGIYGDVLVVGDWNWSLKGNRGIALSEMSPDRAFDAIALSQLHLPCGTFCAVVAMLNDLKGSESLKVCFWSLHIWDLKHFIRHHTRNSKEASTPLWHLAVLPASLLSPKRGRYP